MDNRQGSSKRITVTGLVQGVGFRPYVARLAAETGVCGFVRNTGGTVEIFANAGEQALSFFVEKIKKPDLNGAVVTGVTTETAPPFVCAGFSIAASSTENDRPAQMWIPTDLPVCEECIDELNDPNNRRHRHPFISCAHCGPRFSIITSMPYDREATSMGEFPLCSECQEEYASPCGRRYHAQTVSCHNCGPKLIYIENGAFLRGDEALTQCIAELKSGGVVMLKGIGGYHLTVMPDGNAEKLRELKKRSGKPFAVMFPNIEAVRTVCRVNELEEQLISSDARPIVLLDMISQMHESVVGGSLQCGCFLPYTAIHILILAETGPLVMTSANSGGAPLIFEDKEALAFAKEHNVPMLYHERKIVRPLDDSVSRVILGGAQVLRRARGYCPMPLELKTDESMICTGGDLKSSFLMTNGLHVYLSQYFGDLEENESFERYRQGINDLGTLLNTKPSRIMFDAHPAYHSSLYARERGLPSVAVQHHHAHAASVMAEKDADSVIGVVFDGTGYGGDGTVWGGEFLICRGADFKRAAHLKPVTMLGGDESARDSAKTASCYLFSTGMGSYVNDSRRDIIKAALDNNVNTVSTSSMGRLFDTISVMCGISLYNSYEGESAIRLETQATLDLRGGVPPLGLSFGSNQRGGVFEITFADMLREICLYNGKNSIPLGFHIAVARMIAKTVEKLSEVSGIKDIALCGGVFQNALLIKLASEELTGYNVHINRKTPPNDGSIALGQAYLGGKRSCV